jgi:hypothetical protein
MSTAQSRGLAEAADPAVEEAHLVTAHRPVSKGRKLRCYSLLYLILRNLLRARKIRRVRASPHLKRCSHCLLRWRIKIRRRKRSILRVLQRSTSISTHQIRVRGRKSALHKKLPLLSL